MKGIAFTFAKKLSALDLTASPPGSSPMCRGLCRAVTHRTLHRHDLP